MVAYDASPDATTCVSRTDTLPLATMDWTGNTVTDCDTFHCAFTNVTTPGKTYTSVVDGTTVTRTVDNGMDVSTSA